MAFYRGNSDYSDNDDTDDTYHDDYNDTVTAEWHVHHVYDRLIANQDLPESVRESLLVTIDYGKVTISADLPPDCEYAWMKIDYNDSSEECNIVYKPRRHRRSDEPFTEYTNFDGVLTRQCHCNHCDTEHEYSCAENYDDLVAVIQRLCVVPGPDTKPARLIPLAEPTD